MLKDFELDFKSIDKGGYNQPSKWQITLTHKPSNHKYTTEYTCGCAYRTWTKKPINPASCWNNWIKPGKAVQETIYSKQLKNCESNHKILVDFQRYTNPKEPTLLDTLDSIVSDAIYVWHGESFEDFALELGYDTDSRRAEKCYQGCLRTAQWFRICDVDIKKLSELIEATWEKT